MSKPFELGICMAGAVSAGAYTAGVMDFLIEALQTWEDKKGEPGVPSHEVIIKALGGASAGGMTGIITAAAINNPIVPVTEADSYDLFKNRPENKFYNAWVDLLHDDMFSLLLNTEDIEGPKVYSLFNSMFIDYVGKKSLQVDESEFIQRKFVDENLKIFTTLTNLEGFKYNTDFVGEMTDNDYHLTHHADYATFILNKKQNQYNNDGWIPLNFFDNVNTDIALDAAMATGAFPVGLRSRRITRAKKYVNDLSWNKPLLEKFPIQEDPYEALIIDGGTLNNEPFERVKSLINGDDADKNKDESTFEGTTLMIDPFPSYATGFDLETDDMTSIVGKTLSAMLGHLRSKPEVLQSIFVENNVDQYQIAPVRYSNNQKIEGSKAIACGFMGGFGGFIHKEFRVHDFFLGRANCEHFLREYFTVEMDTKNPIFKKGYQGVAKDEFVSLKGKRQIIPIFEPKKDQMYMPTFKSGTIWPKRREADIAQFNGGLKTRMGKIIMNLSDYNFGTRIFLGIGNRFILRRKLANAVMDTIRTSMQKHDLI